jgi:AraC-like DNA-binding protein
MKLKFYIPPDKKLPYDSIRLAYSSSPEKRIITTPPFGKPVLIFFINPGSVKNFSATSEGVLLGQHTRPLMLDLNENYKVMAIHLKPYALKQLLNSDASGMTNKFTGIKGIALAEELYQLVVKNHDDEKQLIHEMNRFFDSVHLYPVSGEVLAFLKRLQFNAPASVSNMAKEIGVTERTLERKFKAEVGLSPKKYIQILRVFEVFETLKEDTDWQQLVVNYNYTDQAHLINEFKKYANVAPGLYVRKGLTIAGQLPPVSAFEL